MEKTAAPASSQPSLTRFAWLSILAALLTITLKSAAYLLTGSVGLLSDALESGVNLAGALMALAMLTVAARPADESHAYGHSKAEYFSSGFEGALILFAAMTIALTAVRRLMDPQPLEQVWIGLVVSVIASAINFGVAYVLRKAGREHHSITLEADAQHLMTDVWTSVGVVVGVGAAALSGWQQLDPIIALLVSVNIVFSGWGILRKSVRGLMDSALSAEELAEIDRLLASYKQEGQDFHALRTRRSGAWRFISLHVLVPGHWSVHKGHALLERIETDLRLLGPNTEVFTHLEAKDEPVSYEDASFRSSS